MKNISIYKKLSTKEIAVLSMCSLRTADRIKKAIRETYGVKKVTRRHYEAYYLM